MSMSVNKLLMKICPSWSYIQRSNIAKISVRNNDVLAGYAHAHAHIIS